MTAVTIEFKQAIEVFFSNAHTYALNEQSTLSSNHLTQTRGTATYDVGNSGPGLDGHTNVAG